MRRSRWFGGPLNRAFLRKKEGKTMQNHRCKILGLLVLALTLLLGVSGPVNAQAIFINQAAAIAGGVTPGDTPGFPVTITEPGIYILAGRLTVAGDTPAIVITEDVVNVSLFCDGETIEGPGTISSQSIGILLEGGNSLVTIDDCRVTSFRDGFVLRGSNHNVFRRNVVESNRDDGFQLEESNENFFIQNTVRMNGDDGFDLEGSNTNFFTANNVNRNTQNGFALDLTNSGIPSNDNVFVQNNINNNRQSGISLDSSVGNSFISNTANSNTMDGFRILNMSNMNIFMANNACGNRGADFRQTGSMNNVVSNSNGFCKPPTN
jgi:parallel beta-helix repeat protein